MAVKAESVLKQMAENALRGAESAFETVTTDIQRTSSGASPHKTGFLEKNHLLINYGKNSWKGTIYFEAYNGDFDYATWTHEATYNLGEKSRAKPGGSSKFAGHVPVGRRYLARTVEQGYDAYLKEFADDIARGISMTKL